MNAHPSRGLVQLWLIAVRPGGLAWTVATALMVIGVLGPAGEAGQLMLGVLAASAVLVLATARSWRARWNWAESLLLATHLMVVALLMSRLPAAWLAGLTPLLMIATVLVVIGFSHWRFAPDWGQQGLQWAVIPAVEAALWAGLGLVASMVLVALAGKEDAWLQALVYAAGAFAGRCFGRLICPQRGTKNYEIPGTIQLRDQRRPNDEGTFSADWWKQADDF